MHHATEQFVLQRFLGSAVTARESVVYLQGCFTVMRLRSFCCG